MFEYESMDNCLLYYETEKVLLPLMIHQNYINFITNNKHQSDKSKISQIKDIANILSKGDLIENYIYGDQNWDIQNIHGFYTCIATSYMLYNFNNNPDPSYKGSLNDNDNKINLEFTMDLNKTSIKKINKKNITNIKKYIPNMNSLDFLYAIIILRALIANNNIKKCLEIIKNYKLKIEYIDSLLKIDKIKPIKTYIPLKFKKEIIKYTGNNYT